MKKAIIFDWDGTLVSCEEKIDQTIQSLESHFSQAVSKYSATITANGISRGWVKDGFLASLPEDYFTYHFGILADAISRTQAISIDEGWKIILSEFRRLYTQSLAKLLLNRKLLESLSKIACIYIVSNSETDNVRLEIERLGLDSLNINLIGGAKKYKVKSLEQDIQGIPVDRPAYRKVIQEINMRHRDTIVIGDNFCCDLVTPLSMGIRVAYIPNVFTPEIIKRLVYERDILCGTVQDIVKTILVELGGSYECH